MAAFHSSDKKALRIILPCLLFLSTDLHAQKFLDDDPIQKVPSPINVEKPLPRDVSDIYDLLSNTFATPGERVTRTKPIPAGAVNALGDVPDDPAWYTNRHYKHPMTLEGLVKGPGNENAPSEEGPWTVTGAKAVGVTPGFMIRDSKGRDYMLKVDPLTNPEMATGAEEISTKFFYALGYNVPENYVVYFRRSQLVVGKETKFLDRFGKMRRMKEKDVSDVLLQVPRTKDGRYRATASFWLTGTWLGPYRFYGTRKDDPNDLVPHEHRRDLRGYSVFCAWLDHDDSRAINTLDFLVKENGIQFVKHYLVDFGSTLGSGSTSAHSPRSGNEYVFDAKASAVQFLSLGLYVPAWARARYPHLPSVGRFEWKVFEPEKWVPRYPNPAFLNRLPDDAFWAAKQVMAFTDDQIRAIAKTGQYGDLETEKWIAECLIARRDKIGLAFFTKVLPLDNFDIQEGRLVFDNLGVKHKLISAPHYNVAWSRFNNATQQKTTLVGENTFTLPQEAQDAAPGEYYAADIDGGDARKTATVYLCKRAGKIEVVGVDRKW